MPKVGDRVVVDGTKVGGGRREGTLRKVVGSLIQVRWEDGSETLFAPGAGTVQYLPGNGGSGKDAKATKSAPKAEKAKAEKAKAEKAKAAKAPAKPTKASKPPKAKDGKKSGSKKR